MKLYNLFRLSAFLLMGCCWSSTTVYAQDIHFSQYYNTPLTTNPALTGVFAGDIRMYGVVRSQWDAANSSFRTIHMAADGKLYNPRSPTGFFSIGGQMYRDEAGDSDLQHTNLALNGSYTRALDRENFVTFGVQLGAGQRKFSQGNLTWDRQFFDGVHNPNASSNESFSNATNVFFDMGAGMNWHGKKLTSRSTMDVGVGFFHLNRPDQSFNDGEESRMPARVSFYILPTIQVHDRFDVVLNGNAQLQGEYTELLGGAALRYHLNTTPTENLAIQFGSSFRFNAIGDALVLGFELQHRFAHVGFSYDLNVSQFREATNRNGGPELTVRYIIHKLRPLKYRKMCPLL